MREKAYTLNSLFSYLRPLEEISDAELVKLVSKYFDFVNQPFKTSLLLMFEGVEKRNAFAPSYKYQAQYLRKCEGEPFNEVSNVCDKFEFIGGENDFVYQITRGSTNRNVYSCATLCFPRTLHDFIADCDRMGIALEFKSGMLPPEIGWFFCHLKF